ncbi:uroporphyrinogen decarboxylase family protein [Clostridium formicaceticum]|uniref:Uroporphyrinogen decarboxylase n=1 Tax=Clostridium formicaceticum TaxID=1497 RepID=A0AAC9RNX9_9CLOT|nr:uroporphyrinogen decarboxylase family protein [Clostridium formicaceticum]AOY77987.1 uroporphyrinogen decarboxylase [Clostridium formicaceticum]ARE88615.1 Uroporphyrinogen decarboxylase (URO-D) [Clostridium formicaceticum]
MENTVVLSQERTQLFKDLYKGKIPKKVPIGVKFYPEFCMQYANMDLVEVQWNTEKLEEAFDKVCKDFVSDVAPISANRFISFYELLGAKTFVMGSGGFIQHPELHGLEPDEYDEFIKAPYDCIVERVLPRLYTKLDADANTKALTLAKGMKAFYDEFGNFGAIKAKMIQKYGYAVLPPASTTFCEAPYDFIADIIRGFKGISNDIRRHPQKVLEACEAVTPLMIKKGTPPVPSMDGETVIPLHMAPYMREKDFEKFYWPTFKKMVEALAAKGQGIYLFVEHDWMRYLDYLYELPENTRMRFEYGDPKLVKEKLGKKHIVSGFYPLSLLKSGTKEECIDKAKELLDILAPGGKYYFDLDKVAITVDSINVENLKAVLEYIDEKGKY